MTCYIGNMLYNMSYTLNHMLNMLLYSMLYRYMLYTEAPLQLQSQSEAPLQQTLTSTSGHGTVPSLDRACNSKAWTITCRESAPGSPGADSSSWATGFKIKLTFEQV